MASLAPLTGHSGKSASLSASVSSFLEARPLTGVAGTGNSGEDGEDGEVGSMMRLGLVGVEWCHIVHTYLALPPHLV